MTAPTTVIRPRLGERDALAQAKAAVNDGELGVQRIEAAYQPVTQTMRTVWHLDPGTNADTIMAAVRGLTGTASVWNESRTVVSIRRVAGD